MKTYKQLVEETKALDEAAVKIPKSNFRNIKVLEKDFPWFYKDRPERWKGYAADRKDIKKAFSMLKKAKTEADLDKLDDFMRSLDSMVSEKIATAFALDLGPEFVDKYFGYDFHGDPQLNDKNWPG